MADQEFLASFGVDIMMKSERGGGVRYEAQR